MNKTELIASVAQKTELTKKDAEKAVKALFDSISEELAKAGVEVDKKYIKIPGNTIKRTGKFAALIRLHRNVEHNFEFDVVSDAPVEVAPKAAPAPKKVEETEATTEEA